MFLEELSNKKISLSVKFFSIQDMETNIFLNTLISNKEFFEIEFDHKYIKEMNFDNFIKYLIANKTSEIISNISDEINPKYKDFILKISSFQFPRGILIKFINNNYEDIFNNNFYSMAHVDEKIIDVIFDNFSGINEEVFLYLAKNYTNFFIKKYKILFSNKKSIQTFNKTCLPIITSFFNKLIEDKDFIYLYENNQLLDMCVFMIKKKTCEELKNISNAVINDEYERALNMNDLTHFNDNNYPFILKIRDTLKDLGDNRNKKINKIVDKYRRKMNSDLQKNGVMIKTKIMDDSIINIWSRKDNEIEKLTFITHEDRSHPVIVPKHEARIIFDSALTNFETDEYYTFTRQSELDHAFSIGTAFISIMFHNEDYFLELISYIDKYLDKVANILGNKEIYINGSMLIENICIAIENMDIINKSNLMRSTLLYNIGSLASFMCEKLLKEYYLTTHEVDEKFVSLKLCLSNESDAFSYDHIKSLRYFLIQENNIGHNIRNDFAHLNNVNQDNLTIEKIAGTLFIFLDIFNSILLESIDND